MQMEYFDVVDMVKRYLVKCDIFICIVLYLNIFFNYVDDVFMVEYYGFWCVCVF